MQTRHHNRFAMKTIVRNRKARHEYSVVETLEVDALEIAGKMVHLLVMEYVEGRTLRDLQTDLGTVPEALLREILEVSPEEQQA